MKKKILLIVAVILVSVSILSISKIVKEKYLRNDTASLQQNAGTVVKEDNVKEDAKEEIEKEQVKLEIKKEDTKETTKTKVENETPKEQNSAVESKNADSTKVAKVESTEKVEVKEVTKEETTKAPVPKKQPNFIIKDDISGKIILSINLNNENKTVGDLTISQLVANNISYKTSGRGEAIYITMINNLKVRGVGPLSGWCYFVNGSKPGVSCGAYKLKSGDVVEWKYLEDGVNN